MSALTSILGTIGKFVAGEIWDAIQRNAYKPDPDYVNEILGGQKKIEELIRSIDYESQIRDPMDNITRWTQRMQEVVDDLNADESPEHVQAYEELLEALRNETTGIRSQMFRIYATVMGRDTPIEPEGALIFWVNTAYDKLADERNFTCFMSDFITELDNDTAAIAALLHHGLDLAFFIATDANDASRLRDECMTRVTTLRSTLFDAYPPALQQFKQGDYDNDGQFLASWANLWKEGSDAKGRYLTIFDFYCRMVALSDNSRGTVRTFRFAESADRSMFGPLELHAYWKDHDNSRVKFHDDYVPDGLIGERKDYCYTNSLRSGKTWEFLVKLIPLHDKNGVKLVPYFESHLNVPHVDQNHTFGNEWNFMEAPSLN